MDKTRSKGSIQFLQFSAIGGLNALVDLGSLNLLLIIWPTDGRIVLALFNTVAYSLAILNSYLWNSRLTFGKVANFNRQEKIWFTLQALAGLLISNVVFVLAIDFFHWLPFWAIPTWIIHNIAKGLAMVLSSTASFFLMKYIVFTKRKDKIVKRLFLLGRFVSTRSHKRDRV